MYRICIKFHERMWPNEMTSWVVLYDDCNKSKMAEAAIWISNLGHNFGVDQHFCTNFGTEMENRQPKGTQCSDIRFSEIQDITIQTWIGIFA